MALVIPYEFVTPEELEISNEPLAIDTETDNFYGPIMLVQLYQASWDKVKFILKPTQIDLVVLISKINEPGPIEIIAHNASYDMSCIQDQTGIRWSPEGLQDTLYLSRLAYPLQKKHSLDKCYVYALGRNPYRELGLIKQDLQKTDWSEELTEDQLQYAGTDVYFLLDLYDEIKTSDSTCYNLSMKVLKYMLTWQRNGIPVDPDELEVVRKELNQEIEDISEMLPRTLNINSWQQVRAYLNSDESDKLALKTMKCKGNEKAGYIVDKRVLVKRLSFLEEYSKEEHNGRPSGIFAPSAISGRTTCKEINLQQWPRKLKRLVGLPEDGDKVLIYSDFDGLEMRCMAARNNVRGLIKILVEGHSPHDYVARKQFGPDFTETLRQVTKMENFLLLYGGGVEMLRQALIKEVELLFEFDEVAGFKKGWLEVFPEIAEWHKRGFRDHKAKRPWRTPFGREYLGTLGTDHLNIQIQGMGAEVALLAMLYMKRDLEAAGLEKEIKLCSFKHDDYILECDNNPEIYQAGSEILGNAMAESWRVMMGLKDIQAPQVEMPIEVDVGFNLARIDNTGSIYNYSTVGKL